MAYFCLSEWCWYYGMRKSLIPFLSIPVVVLDSEIPHWPWAVSSPLCWLIWPAFHRAAELPLASLPTSAAAGKSQLWPSRKIFQTLSPFLTQSLLSLSRLDTPTQIARVRTPNVISLTITFQLRTSTGLARANENKKKSYPIILRVNDSKMAFSLNKTLLDFSHDQ